MKLSSNPLHPDYHEIEKHIEAIYIEKGEDFVEIENVTHVDENYPGKGTLLVLNNDGTQTEMKGKIMLRWKMVAGEVFRPLFSSWCGREMQREENGYYQHKFLGKRS